MTSNLEPTANEAASPEVLRIRIQRIFQAPRDLVWKAWTENMREWSCPKGFQITDASQDVTPGGKWRNVILSPDGTQYICGGEYREVVPQERLVFTHVWEDDDEAPVMEATVTLTEADGATTMIFEQQGFKSVESRNSHEGGWSDSFGKLGRLLDQQTGLADRQLIIQRVFDAPRDLVWQVFTESNHIAKWWGPRGFNTRVELNDFRVGGRSRYVMVAPNGDEYPVEGTYMEIDKPHRIVSTDEFGEGYEGDTIEGMLMSLTFEELDSKMTRLTLCVTHPSAEDRKKHIEMGVVPGWNSSFDCLDELLETLEERDTSAREIVVSRKFNAPRDLLFEAWTDPKHVSNWWGPVGFTTTTHSGDFQPGGIWRFTMHGPDGRDYENKVEFLEFLRPERLTYRHIGVPDSPDDVLFTSRVTFEEADGGTQLTMRMVFSTVAERDRVAEQYGAIKGGEDTLSRLAEHIEASQNKLFISLPSDYEVRLTRMFDAPRNLVYKAMTQPEHIKHWWGCGDFELTTCEMDFQEGGNWRFVQKDPQGNEFPFKGEYLQIVPGERVVQTFIYDVDMIRDHPAVETVDYIAWGDKTIVMNTIRHDSKEARDGHFYSGMEWGASESMNRLEEYLETQES